MFKKVTTNYKSNNPLSFSNFILDILPDYSIAQIKTELKDAPECTNTVRRVIRYNTSINMRTVFCIYNVFIVPLLKCACEQTKYKYYTKIIKYLNALNNKEHIKLVEVMPIHNLEPQPEYLLSLDTPNTNKINRLLDNLTRINTTIHKLEIKKHSNITALKDLNYDF